MNKAAQQLGRLGGKVTSEAKTAAVRANGALGGRPRRWTVESGYYALRCLVPDGDHLQRGTVLFSIDGDSIFDAHNDIKITPIPAEPTQGWGDLSGNDMVLLGQAITHRKWVEDMIAAAASE